MKLLVLLLVTGCSFASLQEDFELETQLALDDFSSGLEEVVPLHVALGIESTDESRRLERDLKEELKEHIKKAFDDLIEKVNKKVENGGNVNEEALRKLKDLHDQMKELEISSQEIEDGIEHLKEKVDKHLRDILKKMGILDKRSMQSMEMHSFGDMIGDLNLRNILLKIKDMILAKMSADSVKHSLAKILGQGTQSLCTWLTNKGKEKVLNLFDDLLENEVDKRKRDTEDQVQEIKDYLENVEEDAENKFNRFREWLDELVKSGLTKSKDQIEKAREALKKLIDKSKDKSRKNLTDFLEFLKGFKKAGGDYFAMLLEFISSDF